MIDKELLENHNEGIVCLSGCVSGELSRTLMKGGMNSDEDFQESFEIARWFHKVFGDRYFIEIQNNGIEIQRLAMEGSLRVSEELAAGRQESTAELRAEIAKITRAIKGRSGG